MNGTVFNDPANPVTINLEYGEIVIFDDNTGKDANTNDVGWGFDQLAIREPKCFHSANPYVTIHRSGGLYNLDQRGYLTEISDIDISIIKTIDANRSNQT